MARGPRPAGSCAAVRGPSSDAGRFAWGGALRRITDGTLAPAREDSYYPDVAGRNVPIGYARYVSPVVDPAAYAFWRVAGWSVAVPRNMCATGRGDLLSRIYKYGPQSAGYVRWGDTLVPARLSPGDRATIAETPAAADWLDDAGRYGPY